MSVAGRSSTGNRGRRLEAVRRAALLCEAAVLGTAVLAAAAGSIWSAGQSLARLFD